MSSYGNSIRLCIFLSFIFLFSRCMSLQVSYDARGLKFDGIRKLIISGAIHYPRSTPEMWPDLIRKAKEGGLNAIDIYVFWNAHEPKYRQYDFNGNLDFVRFIKTVQNEGLYVLLRIGPYICAEWNYGGFPMWLHNMPGIQFRTNNDVFKKEMQIFTTLIVNMAKRANLFASQGGPIILAQIENEYGNIYETYGDAGKEYIKWAAEMAVQQNISEPWIMCQQNDAPPPMINTCNGFYCDGFTPNRENVPKMFTENWTGWVTKWGERTPHRTPKDLAYSVARFFQKGGALMNYYMYHGGTNFGRTAGIFVTTSYDYDAPLNEYGDYNQPKWGHLKQLHETIMSIHDLMADGTSLTVNLIAKVELTTFSLNGNEACFFGNWDDKDNATFNFRGTVYNVPAWSVSILPDCIHEAYNTAKVNVKTSENSKKRMNNSENQGVRPLKWWWMSEDLTHLSSPDYAVGAFTANKLIDQKEVANADSSDYLWYMTSVTVNDGDALLGQGVTLRVKTSCPILHAFVNSEYIGTQYANYGNYMVTFEKPVKLVKGVNRIALLSVMVGYVNYGAFYDIQPAGVTGKVQLVANNSTTDLSNNEWTYMSGLVGEQRKLYNERVANLPWTAHELSNNRTFTWFMVNFSSPVGNEPVVLDLKGLGKGQAWVNGNSIGRYWISNLVPTDGCGKNCDYRGIYSTSDCATNCGEPTQRWYHVPRSFQNSDGVNTVVLFEEFGGDPSFVSPASPKQM